MKKRKQKRERASPLPTKKQTASQYMDCDYWNKLSPEERAWRNKFDREYYSRDGLYQDDSIHKSKEHRTEINEAWTARDNEIRFKGGLDCDAEAGTDPIDALIEEIDRKNKV